MTAQPPVVERVAGPAEAGNRLDVVVAGWLEESRGRAQERITEGQVTVDGRAPAKSWRLSEGEVVRVAPPPPGPVTDPPPPVAVRHRDDHLAVVVKPAGLVVHAGSGVAPGATLVDALLAQGLPLAGGDDPARPGLVHRLDRGTSGLLVVALSERAHRALVEQFRVHSIERRYWALVDGVPAQRRATIDAPIARSVSRRTTFAVDPAGRRAVSHYDVVEDLDRFAVLEVRLETGRTHQVRVHLAAVGHPVAGDTAYGAAAAGREALGLERPALHAAVLGLDHPGTGERLVLREELPDDLGRALAAARAGPTA